MLGLAELLVAKTVFNQIVKINAASVDGRQGIALDLLGGLADFVSEALPRFEIVIDAQCQAAKDLDLAKGAAGPRLVCGAFMGVPNPYPDTPNSEHTPTPANQPAA